MRENNYQEASTHLEVVNDVLQSSVCPREGEIKILQALHAKYDFQHNKLMADVAKAWLDMVRWEISRADGTKGKDSHIRTTLCINLKANQQDGFANVVQAMADMKILSQKLNNFGDQLLKSVIDPILSFSDLQLQINLEDSQEMPELVLTGKKRHLSSDTPFSHTALDQISEVFISLHNKLFSVQVKASHNGPEGDNKDKVSLMSLLGSCIHRQTVDLIINKSLSHSIPSNSRDLEKYNDFIIKIEAFQNMLVDLGFLHPSNTALTDYVSDVNVLFANKKCQEILDKARTLMTSEIHNMEIITAINTEDLPALGLEGTSSKRSKSESSPFSTDMTLSTTTFQLPTCSIRYLLFLIGIINFQF